MCFKQNVYFRVELRAVAHGSKWWRARTFDTKPKRARTWCFKSGPFFSLMAPLTTHRGFPTFALLASSTNTIEISTAANHSNSSWHRMRVY